MSTPSTPTYSVILPTYNERTNLPLIFWLLNETFTRSQKEDMSYEVIIVDDASPDNTYEVAKSLSEKFPNKIKIVQRTGKLGLGTAYIRGLEECEGTYIILMDADLSHHPKFITQMIENMEDGDKNDIVCGTRYALGGGVAGWDFRRKLTSRGANFLASFLLNPGPSDLTGSFRLYKKSALQKILPRVKSKGYAFQMEILVHAKKEGLKFGKEVPITFVDRIYGESKLGANEIILYIKGLLQLFFTT